ncbi:hypothetical protein [Microterricola gilva]|nr:hypothetical protein [Microterricola gilva]
MTFTIQQPSQADAPHIAALHVATWREAYSRLVPAEFFAERHFQERRAQ